MTRISSTTTIPHKFIHQLCLLMASVFFSTAIAHACLDEIPPPQGLNNETICAVCKTTNISEDKWQAQLIYPDFSMFAFDSYNCMFSYTFSPGKVLSIATLWVKDSLTDKWINGNGAYFNIAQQNTKSSLPILLAFKNKADAQSYANKNTGTVHYYPQITRETLKNL